MTTPQKGTPDLVRLHGNSASTDPAIAPRDLTASMNPALDSFIKKRDLQTPWNGLSNPESKRRAERIARLRRLADSLPSHPTDLSNR